MRAHRIDHPTTLQAGSQVTVRSHHVQAARR
jgi:hypothetical protein